MTTLFRLHLLATAGCAAISTGSWSQTALPTVSITATRNPNEQSLISSSSLFETPISLNSLSAEQLRAQGVTSLSNVIKNDAAAGDAYNTLGYIESMSLRGFLLDNRFNYRRDGLPISNHAPAVLENKQRLEILKGTSGAQAGVSAPGGLVNWIIKKPTDVPLALVSAEVSERGTTLFSGDLGGRLANDQFGYRINASAGQRRPFADQAPGDKQFISGYFDWRLDARQSFAIEAEWLKSKQISVPGFALLDSNQDGVGDRLPAVPRATVNLNNQSWSQPFESRSQAGSLRYLFAVNEQFQAGARLGWQNIRTQDRIAFPDGCSADVTYVYPGLCANGDVDVYDFRSENEQRNTRSADAFLRGKGAIGSVTHDWRITYLNSRYQERFEDKQAYNFVGISNIFSPVALPSDATPTATNTNSQIKTTELSFTDTVKFAQWQALIGLRHTRLSAQSEKTDGSDAVQYTQQFTTPWFALAYQVTKDQLVYVSAGKGIETEFVPNRPDRFVNYGQALPTLVSQQWELGYRQKWGTGHVSAAVFSIRKPYSDDIVGAADQPVLRVAGARVGRHRGAELNWQQTFGLQWDFDANVAFLDARQVVNVDAQYLNKRTVNISPVQVRFNALWKSQAQWSWLNSISVRSGKPVTRDNAVKLGSAWQWDSLFTWTIKDSNTHQLSARVGITNVLNKPYWKDAPTQPWGGIYLFAAEPRAFRLLISSRF
jgi:iron complex outermembrane recepter protein